MRRGLLVVLIVGCLGAGAGPTTRPTTRPSGATTRPTAATPARVRDALVNGGVRYLVPAEWELTKRSDDGLSAQYLLPDGQGVVSMFVTKQQQAFPMGNAALKQKMAESIIKAVNDDLKKRKLEVTEPPKLERDEAFIARIVYRVKEGDAEIRAMHAYRGAGINLVSVTASATTADAKQAKTIHDAAAMMLLSVTTGPADPKLVRPVKQQ